MTDDELRTSYQNDLQETLTVRRYTGTGSARAVENASVKGRQRRKGAAELAGQIKQHDYFVVIYADDMTAGGVDLPLLLSDKIVVDSVELGIRHIIPRTSPTGTLIAYELECRG